jgi:hypothetical protein
MKTSTIPPLRVSPELRKQAQAVLESGETLSGFVLDTLARGIENRKARQEFISLDDTGVFTAAGVKIA